MLLDLASLVIATALVIFFSISISFLLGFKKGLIVIASSLVIAISTIIASLTLLGIFGVLNARNYSLLILSACLVLIATSGKKIKVDFALFYRDSKSRLNLLPTYIKIGIMVFAIVSCWWGMRLLAVPVWDYDAIAYHLPFTVTFLQTQSIQTIPFAALSGPIGYYPANMELLYAHFLMFIKLDSFLHVFNVFLLYLIFLVLYLTGREMGVSKKVSFLSSVAFVSAPLMLRQIGTMRIDIFFVLFFGLIILFLARYAKRRDTRELFIASLAAGVFVGTRYLAVPYIAMPVVIAMILVFQRNAQSSKATLARSIPSILGCVALGGYWYVRNFLVTTNPIFPAGVSLAGAQIFEGLHGGFLKVLNSSSIISGMHDMPALLLIVKPYLTETGMLVPLIILSLFLLLVLQISSRPKQRWHMIFFLAVPWYFYLYAMAPFSLRDFDQNIRYSLPALYVGIVVIMLTANTIIKKYNLKKIIVAMLLLSVLANLYFVALFRKPQAILGADVRHISSLRDDFYMRLVATYGGFAPILDAMQWADGHLPEHASIGYSGFQFYYPLYGPHLTRKVNFIAPGKCLDCNHFDFQKFEGNIFANPDYESWLANIRYYHAEYYVFYNQTSFPESEKTWLINHPEIFRLIYHDKEAYIYQIESN